MKQEDHSPPRFEKPLMIYDGDCAFCGKWIGRWRGMTGDLVEYLPSAEAARFFPEIPLSEFERAVQLIRSDGSRCSGAEAVLEVTAPHSRFVRLISLAYRRSAIMRAFFEASYRFVAEHRAFFSFLTKKL
jgi:predicted DCC family thiol-disulfide oxidoreductase YuxK